MKTYTVVVTIKKGMHLSEPNTNPDEYTQTFIVEEGETPDWNRTILEMGDVIFE